MIDLELKELRSGDVSLSVPVDSLAKLDDVIKSLEPAVIQKLGEAYGVKVGSGQPASALLLMVRSHVQNDWYEATRGEIPMAVKQNHEKRAEQIQNEAAKGDGDGGTEKTPKQRTPKPPSKFALLSSLSEAQETELNKVRGQRSIVVKALKSFPDGATPEEIAKLIESTGEAYPSKDTVVNSVRYHLKGLRDGAYIREITE